MINIHATRSIKHGLPYSAASIRQSHTMETMTTTLITLGRNNSNKVETYLTLWMWWRTWKTYATPTSQMMMKVRMTTWMMKTPLPIPKPKRIPILPTYKWEDGGYGQGLFHRCRSVLVVAFVAFSPNLGDWVCGFGVCVLFSCIF